MSKLFFLFFFAIILCVFTIEDAFQTRNIKDLITENSDLELVFLNQTCLKMLTISNTTFQQNSTNFTFSNIQFAPISFDITNQTVFIDIYTQTINFFNANALLSVDYDYIMTNDTESIQGHGTGQIDILNFSNWKQLSLQNSKIAFLTTSLNVAALTLKFDPTDSGVKKAFRAYYTNQTAFLMYGLITKLTSCLNSWLYPIEAADFFHPYVYQYKDKSITYKYNLGNLNFTDKYVGLWFTPKINNFTQSKTIPVNVTTILNQESNYSQTYYSKSIVVNTILYALDQKFFDLKMNERDFESQHFDYFVGELALFMPELRKHFYADERIDAKCVIADPRKTAYDLIQDVGLYLTLPYNCTVNERNTQTNIFNFTITVNLTLSAQISNRTLDLTVQNVNVIQNSFVAFETKLFPMTKPEYSQFHMNRFIKEMLNSKTFGSSYAVKGDTIKINKDGIILTVIN